MATAVPAAAALLVLAAAALACTASIRRGTTRGTVRRVSLEGIAQRTARAWAATSSTRC